MDLKSGPRDVFIIDITTDKTTPAGVNKDIQTIWYSEELGVTLKRETKTNRSNYSFRVLDIYIPDSVEGGNKKKPNLGTILI